MGDELFVPIEREQVVDSVSQQILDLVRSGELKTGARLPSERELVGRLGVSRSSVREALKGLASLGLIEIRQGVGAFVTDPQSAVPSVATLTVLSQDDARLQLQLMEARTALEITCARLAAQRATPDQLEKMSSSLEEFEEGVLTGDVARMVDADLEFHTTLIQATQNLIFLQMLNPINELLLEGRRRTTAAPEAAALVSKGHRAIYEAIAAGDGERAEQAMAQHLEDALQVLTQMQGAKGNS